MAEYLKELYSWIAFVPNMTFKNFLEIGIIAFVVYEDVYKRQGYPTESSQPAASSGIPLRSAPELWRRLG